MFARLWWVKKENCLFNGWYEKKWERTRKPLFFIHLGFMYKQIFKVFFKSFKKKNKVLVGPYD